MTSIAESNIESVAERLRALEIELPDVAPPVVAGYTPSFVPWVQSEKLLFLSGRLAKRDGQILVGKLGGAISVPEAKAAARGVAIELLAAVKEAVGNLDRVERIVRLFVMVNCTPTFTEPHVVANGASELFLQVFGERGAHARSAIGVAQAPFGACVELELIVQVRAEHREGSPHGE